MEILEEGINALVFPSDDAEQLADRILNEPLAARSVELSQQGLGSHAAAFLVLDFDQLRRTKSQGPSCPVKTGQVVIVKVALGPFA